MVAPLETGTSKLGFTGGRLMLPHGWLLMFLSIALATSGCQRRSAQGQHVRIVVAGVGHALPYLPHTLAQELKLYEKEGLKAAVEVVPGGNKGLQALLGGSTDVVLGF